MPSGSIAAPTFPSKAPGAASDILTTSYSPTELVIRPCPYLGCFEDDPGDHFFTGAVIAFETDCLSLGFDYFGIEYIFECFCGDFVDQEHRR